MSRDFGLSGEQQQLFERFVATPEYAAALGLLADREHLLDDRFLAHIAAVSRDQYQKGQYRQAAAIADIGSTLDDLATPRTKIDLRIAAGQAFAQIPSSQRSSAYAYATAVEEADAAGTPYMVPLARFMLGQFARQTGKLDEARAQFHAAVKGALDPASEVEPDVLWTALKFYGATLLDLARRANPAAPKENERRALDETLVMIPSHLIPDFRVRWGLTAGDDELLEHWAAAKARSAVVVDGVDPLAGELMVPFMRAMYESLSAREGEAPAGAPIPMARYSTNVLTDRVINHFPFFSTYVTREALAKHPESLSIVAHEFTHYWTFLGSLGGYFSALALELQLLDLQLSAPASPAASSGVSSPASSTGTAGDRTPLQEGYRDAQIKLGLLWEAWRPWAEGLALFTELDLDLAESGTLALPLSLFLASLPAFDVRFEDGPDEPTEHPAPHDAASTFAEVEILQSKARAHVLPTYRWHVYLGNSGPGNESCYFTGHALVGALWRRWAERAPALTNSVAFFRALLWLSHSAFDDLLPDWRLPREAFASKLIESFAAFLRRLFDAPADRLSEVVAVCLDRKLEPVDYDLWRFLRDGRRDARSTLLWEARTNAMRRELAEIVFRAAADTYVRELREERDALLGGLLNASRVHLLSQSACEIRLLPQPPRVVCVARNTQGGPASVLQITLERAELDRLAAEARTREDGAAQLYQFVLARPEPTLGFTYVCPVAVAYGQAFEVLNALLRAGHGTIRLNDTDARLLRTFLRPDVQQVRADMARVVQVGAGANGGAATLAAFADRVDRVYLDAFVKGPDEWIERLRRDRLRALLPPSGVERSRAATALDLVMGSIGGLTDEELAARMGVTRDEATATILRIWQSAAVLGQDLIARSGDRLTFAGLRASV